MGQAQKYLENLWNKPKKDDPAKLPTAMIDHTKNPDQPEEAKPEDTGKNTAAVELGRLGGLKGGKARAKKLSAEERIEGARNAANARWDKKQRFAGGLMPSTINKAPKEDLYKAYIDEKLSYRDCCERFKISKNTLKKLLNYYGIEARDTSEAMKIIHDKNPNHSSKGQLKSTDPNVQIQKKKKKIVKSQHISCETCAYWEFCDEDIGLCHGSPPMPKDIYDMQVDREFEEKKDEFMLYGKWFWTKGKDWCRLWAERPIKKTQKFYINQGF